MCCPTVLIVEHTCYATLKNLSVCFVVRVTKWSNLSQLFFFKLGTCKVTSALCYVKQSKLLLFLIFCTYLVSKFRKYGDTKWSNLSQGCLFFFFSNVWITCPILDTNCPHWSQPSQPRIAEKKMLITIAAARTRSPVLRWDLIEFYLSVIKLHAG